MGLPNDDVVLIEKGKKQGETCVITINCPDKTGLGCDLCRIILEFGLYITKGDVSTDGRWCYIVLWVIPDSAMTDERRASLEERLLSVCPPCVASYFYYIDQQSSCSTPTPVYLLKFCCFDRKGLLHDVTRVLFDLELTIQRVKVMTTPDNKVMDLFFITDTLELLHTKKRRDETCGRLDAVLGDSCISCELQLAGPEYESLRNGASSLSAAESEELFSCELSEKETRHHTHALSPDLTKLKQATVKIDNSLSPGHTLFQIQCVDQKGLLYDIMRTSKDCDVQISYGRYSSSVKGYRDIDLFTVHKDGGKINDPDKQNALCSRLKAEMLHPLRVIITNRGPDTELLVANLVETSGKGRPHVFYDVTSALKLLGICIFSAEIWRHSTPDCQWEVYRFLLDDSCEFPLASSGAKNQIVERVRRILMGW